MTPAALLERGRRVERLLADEDIRTALEAVEKDAYEAFKGSDTPAEAEEAWRAVKGLEVLQRKLRGMVEAGKMAASQIERENRTR